MRIVRKQSEFNQLAEIDSDRKVCFNELNSNDYIDIPTNGFYDILDGKLVALFVTEDKNVCLQVDNESFTLIDGEYKCDFTMSDRNCCLAISFPNKSLNISYTSKRTPQETPFFTESEEDVNLGHWINKVLNSIETKGIFIENNL